MDIEAYWQTDGHCANQFPMAADAGSESSSIGRIGMKKVIMRRAKDFLRSEDGPTATEYAVMLALIIVVCITAVKAIGTKANTAFTAVGNAM